MDILEIIGTVLLVAGFVLVGVEMVVPGFGIPGISGIVSLILGIMFTADSVEQGLTTTIAVVAVLAVMLTIALTIVKKLRPSIVLDDSLKVEPGFLSNNDLNYLVGKEGTASTDLKPSGKCNIEGVEFDVRTEGKYILKGAGLIILRIHENTIIVREK